MFRCTSVTRELVPCRLGLGTSVGGCPAAVLAVAPQRDQSCGAGDRVPRSRVLSSLLARSFTQRHRSQRGALRCTQGHAPSLRTNPPRRPRASEGSACAGWCPPSPSQSCWGAWCPALWGLLPALSPTLDCRPSLHWADPSVFSQALGALSSSGKPFLDLAHGRPPLFMALMAPSFAVSRPELLQSRCPPGALLGAWGPAADGLRGARKRTDTLPGHLSPLPSFLLWARHPTCSSGAKFISPWETCTSQF